MKETLEQKVARVTKEHVAIVPYNPFWPRIFEEEKSHLQKVLPCTIVKRIEHFGSTAVPGLPAKPIIDMLVEVSSSKEAQEIIAPVLEAEGYDYFWRPRAFPDDPEHYAWFIKRDKARIRTHHIHMVEKDCPMWDRLYFRDYLRLFPEELERYGELKRSLSEKYPNDRVEYTKAKSEYVFEVTKKAKTFFLK